MTVATLQPSTIDASITSPAPNSNFGAATTLIIGDASGRRAILKFDGLSDGTIPSTSYIASAVLSLYVATDSASTSIVVDAYRQKRAWVEAQVTWNNYSTGNAWQTAGGFGANDCEQTSIGQATLGASLAAHTEVQWTLTASAIQEIVRGTWANNGFLMIGTGTGWYDMYSSEEGAFTAERPKLVVTYHDVFGAMFWS